MEANRSDITTLRIKDSKPETTHTFKDRLLKDVEIGIRQIGESPMKVVRLKIQKLIGDGF